MRYLSFLVFLAILAFSAAGLIYFGQRFFQIYENTFASKLQAKLLTLRFNEIERFAKFLQEKPLVFLFVGDIMLSRGVAKQIEKNQDYCYPFLKIASTTAGADLLFGNLEGPISERGRNQGNTYSFRAKPAVVAGLQLAGFDILSLANNHVWDWGKEALEDTIKILKEGGIEPVGAGRDYKEANRSVIKEINKTKIAFLAYTNLYSEKLEARQGLPGISDFEIETAMTDIRRLKDLSLADIIAVSLHWGEEYKTKANEAQKHAIQKLIEAGADLIIGHHPHVVQEIEQYKGGWAAYSLGNFIFDQNFSEETMTGLMLKIVVQNKKIIEIRPIKIKINATFQPEIIGL